MAITLNEGYYDGHETVKADIWYEKDTFVIFESSNGVKLSAVLFSYVYSIKRLESAKYHPSGVWCRSLTMRVTFTV